MFIKEIPRIFKTILQNKKPFRFIYSRVLFRLHLSRFIPVQRNGYRIRLYPTIMTKFCFDKTQYFRQDEEDFLMRYLRNGDTYIDVGANIGLFTLKAASIVGGNGRIYAFEPMPRIFRVLESNVRFNKFRNVRTYNYGLGDKPSNAYISDHPVDDSVNSVINSGTIRIELRTLDSFDFYKDKKVNLLKVDVEGFELFVLKGAANTLLKTDCVFFESWNTHFEKYGYKCSDVFGVLKSSGFEIYKIFNQEVKRISENYVSTQCEDLIAVRDFKNFKSRYILL